MWPPVSSYAAHCRKDFSMQPECSVLTQDENFRFPRDDSDAADIQPRSKFITSSQQLASSTPSLLLSQHQPDDPRSRPEQPRQKLVLHMVQSRKSQPTEKCVLRSVEPQRWTQTQDCGGGLGGSRRLCCRAWWTRRPRTTTSWNSEASSIHKHWTTSEKEDLGTLGKAVETTTCKYFI